MKMTKKSNYMDSFNPIQTGLFGNFVQLGGGQKYPRSLLAYISTSTSARIVRIVVPNTKMRTKIELSEIRKCNCGPFSRLGFTQMKIIFSLQCLYLLSYNHITCIKRISSFNFLKFKKLGALLIRLQYFAFRWF